MQDVRKAGFGTAGQTAIDSRREPWEERYVEAVDAVADKEIDDHELVMVYIGLQSTLEKRHQSIQY